MRHRPLEIPGHFIDPPDIHIVFDGRTYSARTGESIALTLLAHGVYTLGRSAKYHRPRGVFCLTGDCGQCVAHIDDHSNTRTCQHAAHHNCVVASQNTLGTATHDVLGLIDWAFPQGLDHHHLMTEIGSLNKLTVQVARRLGGLGTPPHQTKKNVPKPTRFLRSQVVILGGGLSGQELWSRCKNAGIDVILLDRLAVPNATIGPCDVLGFYDERTLVVTSANEQVRIHAEALVIATGSRPLPPSQPGNDLPGLFSLQAAERCLEHGIVPGRKVVVVLENILDVDFERHRLQILSDKIIRAGGRIVAGFHVALIGSELTVQEPLRNIVGDAQVRRVETANLGFECDAVVYAGRAVPNYELAQQAGIRIAFAKESGFVPVADKQGRTHLPGWFVVGEAAGVPRSRVTEHARQVAQAVIESILPTRHEAR